jgi:hypothetical protein
MSTAKKKPSKDAVTDAMDAAAEQFATAADRVKGGLDAALDASAEQARAACAFEGVEFAGRETVDAALKASEAYYAGLKDLNDLWFNSAKEAARFNSDAVKALSGCKTPQDLGEVQCKLATQGFEAAMASANTLGQTAVKAAVKTAGDVSAPFAQYWNKSAA